MRNRLMERPAKPAPAEMPGEMPGVLLCSCGGTLFTEAEGERIAAALRGGSGGAAKGAARKGTSRKAAAFPSVVVLAAACDGKSPAASLRRLKTGRLVFAGCSLLGRPDLQESLAAGAGVTPSAVRGVNLRQPALRRASGRVAVPQAVAAVQRALRALALQPLFERRRIPLAPGVLVVGAGPAGREAASRLRALGHPVTLADGSRLRALNGQVGAFTARVQTPAGETEVKAGAVIVASAADGDDDQPAAAPSAELQAPSGADATRSRDAAPVAPPLLPLAALEAAAAALPRRPGVRTVGILLDRELDEPRASTEQALHLALRLQQRDRVQVFLFCRDVRVAALPLEELYDQARRAGVEVLKYAGAPGIDADARGVTVRLQEQILGGPVELRCDLLGVSPDGLRRPEGGGLAGLTGVSTDALGRLQENNVRLFPEKTNRPGVFVVGPARGESWPPQAIREAQAAALAAHRLLAPGALEVELSNAVVDPDKCALCLTCVRSCPFQAMRVGAGKGAAESIPEVCQRCGICAGECPAKAIELPVYSDRILLGQLAGGADTGAEDGAGETATGFAADG